MVVVADDPSFWIPDPLHTTVPVVGALATVANVTPMNPIVIAGGVLLVLAALSGTSATSGRTDSGSELAVRSTLAHASFVLAGYDGSNVYQRRGGQRVTGENLDVEFRRGHRTPVRGKSANPDSGEGMVGDKQVAYDHVWTAASGLPARSRLRFGLTKASGAPIRFVVQLEYRHEEEWFVVARFDHDAEGPAYRNVERSGLHLDLYDPEQNQIMKIENWTPQPANEAMGTADEYLRAEAKRVIRRFEGWL